MASEVYVATVDKQIAQNRNLTRLLLATSAQAAADLNNRPAAIDPDLLEHMENSCLNNVLCLFCILDNKKSEKSRF